MFLLANPVSSVDDGPLDYTNDMLDLLKAYNFKATFFVSGVNFHKGQIDDESTPWPAAIRRAYAEGHQIASHSWSHADLSTNITDARRLEEMIKPEMALRNIMGKFPTYMRPPYIECNAACLALMDKLGYHVIYFDLNTRDYLYITPDTNQVAKDIVHDYLIQQGVQEYLSILHDVHWQTVHNLSVYMFDEMVRGNWKGMVVVRLKERIADCDRNDCG